MTFSHIIPPLLSFVLTLIGIFAILKLFPRLGLLDRPHEYGLSRPPIPYSGGIIFFIVFLVATLFFVDITKPIASVILASILIVFVSFLDDRKRLPPFLRLLTQIMAGIIVVVGGVKIQMINNPLGGALFLDSFQFSFFGQQIWILSAIAIIIWLVLMMNVMNWLDGIPGMSSGISTIAQISLFILSIDQFHVVDQSAVITISSVLAVSTLVFLFFDFYPPKLLMGDTGSMFLGFMLGVLSIIAGGKLATALLIMGFPVLDAFWVIFRRVLKGESPFKGDLSHFHHRLLKVGLTPRKALILNYLFCALFAAVALFLNSTFEKFIAFLLIFAGMIVIGTFVFFFERKRQV